MITLTDIDGVNFELDIDIIKEMHDRGSYREITCHIVGLLRVKETIPEIMAKIRKVRLNGHST